MSDVTDTPQATPATTTAPDAATPPPPPGEPAAGRRLLSRMLDRLFAALENGPGLNCRPHHSRQRVDLTALSKLGDAAPGEALARLLGDARAAKVKAKVRQPKPRADAGDDAATPEDAGRAAAERAWDEQNALLAKLHVIAEDARTYENDTGVHVLNVGFPLLSLPPGSFATAGGSVSRRVLAPIAFVPVTLTLKRGGTRAVEIACRGEGVDLVRPNEALLAWLQQQSGQPVDKAPELFADERGEDPWREITELVRHVCRMLEIAPPPPFAPALPFQSEARIAFDGPAVEGPPAGAAPVPAEPSPAGDPSPPSPGTPGEGGGEGPGSKDEGRRMKDESEDGTSASSSSFSLPPSSLDSGPHPNPLPEYREREPEDTAAGAADAAADVGRALPASSPVAAFDAPRQEPTADATTGGGGQCPPYSLSPAPRADDAGDRPTVVLSAVLGLFPMANQGLLRDMQEMAAGRIPPGPIESFLRVGVTLDRPPTTDRAPDVEPRPVAKRRRQFADERLVAPADPCQSRAVRLARECRGLVVHGPPGTGKSQTITNVIADHLARGLRVLFVCDKRTALDVVANRLRHMGLGRLVAIVHDPQRDQRELYRSIRQQLDDLTDAAIDPRAEKKLETADADLQRLHDELAAYRAALTKTDPDTHLSFHDLVGQWLGTPTAPGLSLDDTGDDPGNLWGEPRSSGSGPSDRRTPLPDGRGSPHAALRSALAGVRLADLDAREPAVREVLRRAADVGYADNPWRPCAGIGLTELLARPADWYRSVMADVVDAAAAADASIQPDVPPFAAEVDLKAQADARVALADDLAQLADAVPAAALGRWAEQELPALRAVRSRLIEAGPYLQAMNAGALDEELLRAMWTARGGLPSLPVLAEWRARLQKYADAYATWSAWVVRVRQAAPEATIATLARWVSADEPTYATASRALKTVAPLAERIKAGPPIDAELLAQYRRQPFDVPHLLRWQSAVDNYLPVAGSLLGFLHGAKKKAAAPAAEFFGLGMNAAGAKRLHDFLAALRPRLEVYEALQKALGPGALTELPDDDVLLATFRDHHGALTASADLHRPPGGEARSVLPTQSGRLVPVTDLTDLVHRMIGQELEAVSPLFADFGLFPNPVNVARVRALYQGLGVRLTLQDVHARLLGGPVPDDTPLLTDAELEASIRSHAALLDLVLRVRTEPALNGVATAMATAMADPNARMPAFLDGLRRSPARAGALERLERALAEATVFSRDWLAGTSTTIRWGEPFAARAEELAARVDTLEGVVRARRGLAELPEGLRNALTGLLLQSQDPSGASRDREGAESGERPLPDGRGSPHADVDEAWAAVRRAVLAGEITRRLAADPLLQDVDGRRVQSAFERYRQLEAHKRDLVRDAILARWVGEQRDRLLADTGTRLNSLGAELRRRLLLRGERAMRLRQVVATGRRIDGGDPLFDLAPVWMVSPETAAQVFPREPIFDVVVFDEASQCRLEEALPVLTRGSRVVIAGDPRQLPPTRFFESAVTPGEGDDEPETDQDLFEAQQGEVEDLLAAALGLEIEQCYLDVHYRSKNADLIGFSNTHFYGSRLQPLPGRPTGLTPRAPVRLHAVGGVYDKRQNEKEADAVCQLVRELLSRDDPPSIGVASFNLPQRDLIWERLEDLAEADPDFGRRLAAARTRTGAGSFEGLFVKNLENVQGDERDHVIISTTYGPDPRGRFYRRFGPLGMPGGARRLNVLVTRAREEVHLVTSVPPDAYRTLFPLESGQSPGGAWLLFAYLQFAERLAHDYAPATTDPTPAAPAPSGNGTADTNGDGTPPLAAPPTPARGTQPPSRPTVTVRPTRAPSAFVPALASHLANCGVASDVYWGNDGFCVDVAVRHPDRPEEVTLGVLCDAARFTPAEDPTEWDVFRTAILEGQGWRLHRLWTPHVFRDPAGAVRGVLDAAERGAEAVADAAGW